MQKKNKNTSTSLKPEDYYFNEQGLMVFTKEYLKRRGFCCKNGCLNCPWGFKKK